MTTAVSLYNAQGNFRQYILIMVHLSQSAGQIVSSEIGKAVH